MWHFENANKVVDPKMKRKVVAVHVRSFTNLPLAYDFIGIRTLIPLGQPKASGGSVSFSTRESQLCQNVTVCLESSICRELQTFWQAVKVHFFLGSILI